MSDYGAWYFSKEQLCNSVSRKNNVNMETEVRYRQEGARFIQTIGEKIGLDQLSINTGIVFMHRFYMYHSFTKFHRHAIAAMIVWFVTKLGDKPRQISTTILLAFPQLLENIDPTLIMRSTMYQKLEHEMKLHENLLLATLGFELTIIHPNMHILRCCEMLKVSTDLTKWAVHLANDSLHMTSLCLEYPPTILAAFFVYFVTKWAELEIPLSSEGKLWFTYIDNTITETLLQEILTQYLAAYEKNTNSILRKELESRRTASEKHATPDSGYESPKLSAHVTCPIKKLTLAKVFGVKRRRLDSVNSSNDSQLMVKRPKILTS